jgi:hypothetical protein
MVTDLVVVGAGPVGLFAAFYAGLRGMSVTVVDSLDEPGGQISALYPEKLIRDVAGLPSVRGRDLVDALVRQAEPFSPQWRLGHSAISLDGDDAPNACAPSPPPCTTAPGRCTSSSRRGGRSPGRRARRCPERSTSAGMLSHSRHYRGLLTSAGPGARGSDLADSSLPRR